MPSKINIKYTISYPAYTNTLNYYFKKPVIKMI